MSFEYPKISVVTVCFNSINIIEDTLNSVLTQDYPNLEYVVIDGQSNDGTVEILKKYQPRLGVFLSEPDSGVYEGMNKGIRHSSGEYLLFMNAGDIFYSYSALKELVEKSSADVIYGDFNYLSGPRQGRVSADFPRGIFNHQSVLYRRALHSEFGEYLSVKRLTAADYLFFMSVQASTTKATFEKVDVVVASVDPNGMSAGLQTFLQVGLIDCLLQRRSRYQTAFRIAVHPVFNFFRNLLRRAK